MSVVSHMENMQSIKDILTPLQWVLCIFYVCYFYIMFQSAFSFFCIKFSPQLEVSELARFHQSSNITSCKALL